MDSAELRARHGAQSYDPEIRDLRSQFELKPRVACLTVPVLLFHIQDELLEELEELEQEELARDLLTVGDKEEEPPVELPSVPSTHLPVGPGTRGYTIISRT